MPNKTNAPHLIESMLGSTANFNMSFEEMASDGVNLYWLLNNSGKIEFNNSRASDYLKEQFDIEVNEGMVLHDYLPEKIGGLIKGFMENPESKGELQTSISLKDRFLHLSIVEISKGNSINGYAVNIYFNSGLANKTESLQLLLQQKNFIIDHLFDVIWTLDKNYNLNFVSKSIYNQRGFTSDEYLKLSLKESMTPESVQLMNDLILSVKPEEHSIGNPLIYTAEYYKKDGSTMIGESILFSIIDKGRIKSIYGVTRDITDRVLSLRKIEEKNSELETILNNTEEMIASIDLDFKIVTMNNANKRRIKYRLGKTPQIGDPILNYVNKENIELIKKVLKEIASGERNIFQHIFTTNYNGQVQFFDSSIKPIVLDKKVIGMSVFVKDITDTILTHRALEESENRLQRITGSSIEGVWEYDLIAENLYLSHRLKKIVGYQGKNDLIEFKSFIKKVVDPNSYEKFKDQLFNHIKTDNSFSFEVLIKVHKNNKFWIQIKAYITKNLKGQPVLVSGIILDITDRKNREVELRKAKENAEEMNRLKTNFIANMSHEVRTPLNGILGVSQLLEQKDLPEEIKHYLKLQKESGFRLLDTINNIMSLSQLEAWPNLDELKPFDLNAYIIKNIEPFEILARQKNIDLKFYPSKEKIMLPINEQLFYHVFNNLIGNAVKFTLKGKVKLNTNIENDFAIITIADTGVGIHQKNLKVIFDAFVQESSGAGRHFEGSGLGLAIVKKYVEWSGGSIYVESKKKKGSIFILRLPLIS